jgi:lysozyme
MKLSNKGLDLIKTFEGFRDKPYLCSAKICTIGWGTTIYPNGKKVTLTDAQITKEQGEMFLKNDVIKFERGVVSLLGTTKVNQNQFDALVSFAYNCGLANLKTSTLLKIVRVKPDSEAIYNQFLRWNKAAGKELAGLTRRRKAEADLYFSK